MSTMDDSARKLLWDTYGKPETVDAKTALEALDMAEIDPRDVVAVRYRDHDAAAAYQAANIATHGPPRLGTYSDADAVIGVLDLRPAIEAMNRAVQPGERPIPIQGIRLDEVKEPMRLIEE